VPLVVNPGLQLGRGPFVVSDGGYGGTPWSLGRGNRTTPRG
jgi:hypothetical protein